MQFETMHPEAIIERSASSNMLLATGTVIETKISGTWKEDAKDSDKPMQSAPSI